MVVSLKSIVSGVTSVICGGVLLMPLLVQPNPVSAQPHAAPAGQAIAAALPDEDCPPAASTELSENDGLQPSGFRPERTCPRVPMRLAQQAGTVAR